MELGAAVVAGHICLDIIPQFDPQTAINFHTQFQPGSLTRVGPAIFSTGGAVSNTGLALHKLGIPTRLVARIGDDLFGQEVLRIVASFGANLAQGHCRGPRRDDLVFRDHQPTRRGPAVPALPGRQRFVQRGRCTCRLARQCTCAALRLPSGDAAHGGEWLRRAGAPVPPGQSCWNYHLARPVLGRPSE